jgi:hypothetical protein
MDPIDFESRFTVFDFTFFINRLIEELNEEAEQKEKQGDDKLIKILRVLKHTLNQYDL